MPEEAHFEELWTAPIGHASEPSRGRELTYFASDVVMALTPLLEKVMEGGSIDNFTVNMPYCNITFKER